MTTMISNAAQNGIERAARAQSIVWHLILSLVIFCEVEGIDFDEAVADAKQHWANETPEGLSQ